MRKFRYPELNDPDDLGEPSTGALMLYHQMNVLDFARRYYKRKGDAYSLRRSKELKKLLYKISQLQTQGMRALVPSEIIYKQIEIKAKWCEKFDD